MLPREGLTVVERWAAPEGWMELRGPLVALEASSMAEAPERRR